MNLSRTTAKSKALILTGAAMLILAGCSGYDDDDGVYYTYGEPYYYASDYYYMGTVYDPYYYYFKRSAQPLAGEEVQEPLTFHEDCACFVRRATYTGVPGYERERIDTVTLVDSAGATITTSMQTAKASTIHHKRYVKSLEGSRQADLLFDLTADVSTDSDSVTTSVWNGTITGSFNEQEIRSGSVDSVVRVWADSSFGYPIGGSLTLESDMSSLVIQYHADSSATATITNNNNGNSYELNLDEQFRESEPVLAK